MNQKWIYVASGLRAATQIVIYQRAIETIPERPVLADRGRWCIPGTAPKQTLTNDFLRPPASSAWRTNATRFSSGT
ncbi:MAG: hypothetical protein JWR21_3428 [Herminiimonas sp.]|nr:hypothetical protein [Herminiimonas sp.]